VEKKKSEKKGHNSCKIRCVGVVISNLVYKFGQNPTIFDCFIE